MFSLFKSNKKPQEPLTYELRKMFENNIVWLNQEFPEPPIEQRRIFSHAQNDFPIEWDGSEESAKKALKTVAENMQILIGDLELEFYDTGLQEIDMGMNSIFLESDPESPAAAGLYFDKDENGKYTIGLDRKNLTQPDVLISTLAHELSHVKLLGEKQLEDNDEVLTDLTTVFFGFGVFNANTCFQFHKSGDRWGYQRLGYMKQEEWGYALALLAFLRYEDNPDWSTYLNPTLKKDFDTSLQYMLANQDEIFRFDD